MGRDDVDGRQQRWARVALLLSLTAVFVGYLSVWLPGPGAGLSFLGIELGEWIKFMGVGVSRNLLYLPPITLALMLVAVTLPAENGQWQTWALRGMAGLISLLAFPAFEDITGPLQGDYLPRVQWIGLVLLAIMLAAFICWKVKRQTRLWLCWLCLFWLGLLGAIQPARVYLQIQPNLSQLFGTPVGFGPGFVLNVAGHLVITAISLWQLVRLGKEKRSSRSL